MARTPVDGQTPTNELTEVIFTNVAAGVGNGANIRNYNKNMLLLVRNPHASNPTGNTNMVPSGTPPGGATYTAETVVITAGKIYMAKGMSAQIYEDSNGALLLDIAGSQAVDVAVINC